MDHAFDYHRQLRVTLTLLPRYITYVWYWLAAAQFVLGAGAGGIYPVAASLAAASGAGTQRRECQALRVRLIVASPQEMQRRASVSCFTYVLILFAQRPSLGAQDYVLKLR